MTFIAKLSALAATTAVAVMSMATPVSAVGSATYALSGGSATVGNNVTVTLSEDSGAQPVNGVSIRLSYDASKLEFVTPGVGAFTTCVPAPSGGSGAVSYDCVSLGTDKTGPQVAAVITFKAIAAGAASVSLNDSSSLVKNSTDYWNHAAVANTVTVSAPAAAPAPAPAAAAPAKKTTTAASTPVAESAAPDATTAPSTVTTDVKSAEQAKANDTKKTADKKNEDKKSAGWLYWVLIALIAISIGSATARRVKQGNPAAVAAAKKPVEAKPVAETAKKTAKKSPAKKR